jgi:hypothetical protein
VLRFAGLPASLAQTALLHLFRSRNARFHSAFFVHNALGRPTGEAFVLASTHVARSFPRRLRLPPPGAHAPCSTSTPLVLVVPHSIAALQDDYERRALVGRWVGWPSKAASPKTDSPTCPGGRSAGRSTLECRAADAAPGGRDPLAIAVNGDSARLELGAAGSSPAASLPPQYGFVGDRLRDCVSAATGPRLGEEGLAGAAVGVRSAGLPVCVPSAGHRPGLPYRPRPADRQLVRVIRTTPAAVGDVCRPPLFHPADKAPAAAPPVNLYGPVVRGLRASASHPFFWRARAYAPYAGGALTRLDPHVAALARMQV